MCGHVENRPKILESEKSTLLKKMFHENQNFRPILYTAANPPLSNERKFRAGCLTLTGHRSQIKPHKVHKVRFIKSNKDLL